MRPLFFALLLAACQPAPSSDNAILAIGDSIMAWNGNRGIPEVVGAELGLRVVDASQSGARLNTDSTLAQALGFDITEQVRDGAWDWIILTAGGNDLRGNCERPDTVVLRDAQIGPDLMGDLSSFIASLRARGSKVAFVGYYDLLPDEPAPCEPQFDIINERLTELAAGDAGLVFLDAATVIDRTDPNLFARDRLHPSPEGSARIGAALAQAMQSVEGA